MLYKPNTTHVVQPADIVVFNLIKQKMREGIHRWHGDIRNINAQSTLGQYNLMWEVAWPAFEDVFSRPEIVQTAWRKAGLFPWNPNAPDFSKLSASNIYKRGEFPDPNPSYDRPQEHIVPESRARSGVVVAGARAGVGNEDGAGGESIAGADAAGAADGAGVRGEDGATDRAEDGSWTGTGNGAVARPVDRDGEMDRVGAGLDVAGEIAGPEARTMSPNLGVSSSQSESTSVAAMELPLLNSTFQQSASHSPSPAPPDSLASSNSHVAVPLPDCSPIITDMDLDSFIGECQLGVSSGLQPVGSRPLDAEDLHKDYWFDTNSRHLGSAAASSNSVVQKVTSPPLSLAIPDPFAAREPDNARSSISGGQSEDIRQPLQNGLPHSAGLPRATPRPGAQSATVTSSAQEDITSLEQEQDQISASVAQKSWKLSQYELIFLTPDKVAKFERLYQAGHLDVRNTDYKVTNTLLLCLHIRRHIHYDKDH